MIRGLYTSTSGLLVENAKQNVISNNLANVDTIGYKKDILITTPFPEMMMNRLNDPVELSEHFLSKDKNQWKISRFLQGRRPYIGILGTGAAVDEIATLSSQGPLVMTENKLDFAIKGKGLFTVETERGYRLTRGGNFSLNSKGEVVTQDGYPVLGIELPADKAQKTLINKNGQAQVKLSRIKLNMNDKMNVSPDGTIYINDDPRFKMAIGHANRKDVLKEGHNYYKLVSGEIKNDFDSSIKQGFIEKSNVNIVKEMVNMIETMRTYEANQKVVTAQDSTLDKAVNDVARV